MQQHGNCAHDYTWIALFDTFTMERTWFSNFRVRGVRQNSHLKQAKLGTLEYSGVNQAITV